MHRVWLSRSRSLLRSCLIRNLFLRSCACTRKTPSPARVTSTTGAILLTLLSSGAGNAQVPDTAVATQYVLHEVEVHRLPLGFHPHGLDASPDGNIIIWSTVADSILNIRSDGTQRWIHVHGARNPVGVACASGCSEVNIADAGRTRLLRASQAGTLLWDSVASSRFVGAAWAGGVWYGLAPDTAGDLSVVSLQSKAEPVARISLPDHLQGRGVAHISSTGDALLIALLHAPYRVHWIDPRTGESRVFAAIEGVVPADTSQTWVALPPVPTWDGYIQTLSDLRSDLRILIRYDTSGRILRRQQIRAPIAIIGSQPTERVLFAARDVGWIEVVRYEARERGVVEQKPHLEEFRP